MKLKTRLITVLLNLLIPAASVFSMELSPEEQVRWEQEQGIVENTGFLLKYCEELGIDEAWVAEVKNNFNEAKFISSLKKILIEEGISEQVVDRLFSPVVISIIENALKQMVSNLELDSTLHDTLNTLGLRGFIQQMMNNSDCKEMANNLVLKLNPSIVQSLITKLINILELDKNFIKEMAEQGLDLEKIWRPLKQWLIGDEPAKLLVSFIVNYILEDPAAHELIFALLTRPLSDNKLDELWLEEELKIFRQPFSLFNLAARKVLEHYSFSELESSPKKPHIVLPADVTDKLKLYIKADLEAMKLINTYVPLQLPQALNVLKGALQLPLGLNILGKLGRLLTIDQMRKLVILSHEFMRIGKSRVSSDDQDIDKKLFNILYRLNVLYSFDQVTIHILKNKNVNCKQLCDNTDLVEWAALRDEVRITSLLQKREEEMDAQRIQNLAKSRKLGSLLRTIRFLLRK